MRPMRACREKPKIVDTTTNEKSTDDNKENFYLNEEDKNDEKIIKKPVGFWSKKLQDLEEEQKIKDKHCGLYEFSTTDDSDSSYKNKKKPRVLNRKTKGRQPRKKLQIKPKLKIPITKMLREDKKLNEIHDLSLCREKIILTKERKKLKDKGEKFTFNTGIPSLGITSTPAVNKDNLIGASNFLFLSPILQVKEVFNNSKSNETEVNPVNVHMSQETPKVKKTNRRVLRNGKVLNL